MAEGAAVRGRIDRNARYAVLGATAVTCGVCRYCQSGDFMFCTDRRGMGHGVNGAFTRYTCVRPDQLFRLDDALPEELLSGVRAVATGDAVVAPRLTRRLLDTFAHQLPSGSDAGAGSADPSNHPLLSSLTERELHILTVIGQGWTNSEIAERLHLAESTVKTHVGRILAKTGSRDRVQAVILAYDTKLVRPS